MGVYDIIYKVTYFSAQLEFVSVQKMWNILYTEQEWKDAPSGKPHFDKYNGYLNDIFLQYTDNDLLLELQWCSTNTEKTIDTILDYSRETEIDYDVFGRFLIDELEAVYKEMDINNFATNAYSVWNLLPKSKENIEPFWTLCYADDPLSWGDEMQTRELYEKMFKYYESNHEL